ncbi:hypothetical protein [Nocardia sp. AG03]|uniref:hypothetical protein n=1 Tax=Nocardia sp. AG03 TaxID=3025312 RepID=UPI002418A160|nr:hypothetical protein [Nocardia sp. AG03]
MARYEQWDDDPEEDVDDRRWNGQRWPHASTDDGHGGRQADLPRVNPYAMVALAAALVLLFPIAIVFGLLSFGHPRGRGIAVLALLLGTAEVAAAATVGLAVFGGFDVSLPNLAQTTASTTAPTPVVSAHGTPVATGEMPVASPTPAANTPVLKGGPCAAEQAGLLGVTADGATLLCLRKDGVYAWSGPFKVSGSYYAVGTGCDPSVDKTGRTSDDHALVCEGKAGAATWVLWTE